MTGYAHQGSCHVDPAAAQVGSDPAEWAGGIGLVAACDRELDLKRRPLSAGQDIFLTSRQVEQRYLDSTTVNRQFPRFSDAPTLHPREPRW